jgi:hypothetical protein
MGSEPVQPGSRGSGQRAPARLGAAHQRPHAGRRRREGVLGAACPHLCLPAPSPPMHDRTSGLVAAAQARQRRQPARPRAPLPRPPGARAASPQGRRPLHAPRRRRHATCLALEVIERGVFTGRGSQDMQNADKAGLQSPPRGGCVPGAPAARRGGAAAVGRGRRGATNHASGAAGDAGRLRQARRRRRSSGRRRGDTGRARAPRAGACGAGRWAVPAASTTAAEARRRQPEPAAVVARVCRLRCRASLVLACAPLPCMAAAGNH